MWHYGLRIIKGKTFDVRNLIFVLILAVAQRNLKLCCKNKKVFLKLKKIFIYLFWGAMGLSCSVEDLSLWYTDSLVTQRA